MQYEKYKSLDELIFLRENFGEKFFPAETKECISSKIGNILGFMNPSAKDFVDLTTHEESLLELAPDTLEKLKQPHFRARLWAIKADCEIELGNYHFASISLGNAWEESIKDFTSRSYAGQLISQLSSRFIQHTGKYFGDFER